MARVDNETCVAPTGSFNSCSICDNSGRKSRRSIRPLALHFRDAGWTVAAWCERRNDFRSFRLDRITKCVATGARFDDEPGKRLENCLRAVGACPPRLARDG